MLIGAWAIIIQTVILYKKNWRLFLLYQLWIILPSIFTLLFTGNSEAFLTIFANRPIFLWITIIIMIIIVVGAAIISFWFFLSFIRAIATTYTGKKTVKIEQTVLQTIYAVWPAILTSILVLLTVFGGFLLIIIPGILFAIWFAFSIYAVVLDQIHHPIAAMKYSLTLVRHRWWSVLWRIFAPEFFFGILIFIIEWLLVLPATMMSQHIYLITNTIVHLIIQFLTGPLTISTMIILYIELKRTPVEQKNPLPKNLPIE